MKLSRRLEMVASMADPGCTVADVGTDHAYVPIWLVEQKVAAFAFAMDVRPGPLERAKNHIAGCRLQDKITTRLSDGVGKLSPGEADTVIIAGMGGELIIHIMDEGRHVWDSVKTWILSPQSELFKVRHFLEDEGFSIVCEDMVCEDGKYYTAMKVVRGRMELQKPAYYLYGKYLAEIKHPVLREYLEKEKLLCEKILDQMDRSSAAGSAARKQELIEKLKWIEEIQHEM